MGTMTVKRRNELELNQELKLTPEEIAEGYLFCCEWDGLLIHKTDKEAECCSCLNSEKCKENSNEKPN